MEVATLPRQAQGPAYAPKTGHSPRPIRNISEVRRFFRANRRPILCIGPTDFNLAGMEQWVANFSHVCQIDSYDGRHPRVFVPGPTEHEEFGSIEDVNNYLLRHQDVRRFIGHQGERPVAVFLMFDETTEELCAELGLEVWFPAAALRHRCDNKVETVRIANRAGVPSVPNVLAKVRSYAQLMRLAKDGGLGQDLVVQLPYGDSGHTTFFISTRSDWRRYASQIRAEREVKVMKRIDPLGSTLEACATRCGTITGPLLTEVIGCCDLTPYRGGWCGNELFAGAFTEEIRTTAGRYAQKLGDQLFSEGYRGYFDVDFLIDRPTGQVYLGELNPRVCGASPLTNHGIFAYADVPLFLFHLLEFSGVEFDLDVEEINERWSDTLSIDSWGQLVIKSTSEEVDLVTAAPPSGLWRLNGDECSGLYGLRVSSQRSGVRTGRALPAYHGTWGLPLRGGRPRHPYHPGKGHERRVRAHGPSEGVDQRPAGPVCGGASARSSRRALRQDPVTMPVDRPQTAADLGLMRVGRAREQHLVTLANWQQAPWNRWSFQHVAELIPCARIQRGLLAIDLPPDPVSLDGLLFESSLGRMSLSALLERSYTDGFIVLHHGKVVTEQYFNGMLRESRHILQSISKSFTGALVGSLTGVGLLEPPRLATDYVPELRNTSFEGATIRHLLDMRAGTQFTEDYNDPQSDVNLYEVAAGWRPVLNEHDDLDLLQYIRELPNYRHHGEVFQYRSILTDTLALVIERASGMSFAEALSELVWAPLGAEHDAEITVDRHGNPMADGGISATLRDLARFGQLYLQGGCVEGRQIVPAAWVNDTRHADEECRRAFMESEESSKLAICDAGELECLPHGHYRNQWWVPDPEIGVLLGSGIYGQVLYVNMFANVVVAKLSSQPEPFDATLSADVLRACAALCGALAVLG